MPRQFWTGMVIFAVLSAVVRIALNHSPHSPPHQAERSPTLSTPAPVKELHTLLPRVAAHIEPLVRDSLRLQEVDGDLPLGASRVGGVPDLPPAMKWPRSHAGPLAFLAQIDLAEIAPLDREQLLPRQGTLYFFYDAAKQPWGFTPADRGSWLVWHDPGDRARLLVRASFPAELPAAARFRPRAVRPFVETTLPPWDSADMEPLALTAAEGDVYLAFLEGLHEQRAQPPLHRLLGNPDPIQGDMQLEAQLTSHGLYTGNPAGYKDPRAKTLAPGARDWRLLLQIDSSDGANMMWGDSGTIYFWIPLASLKAQRFDDVWTILQCG
jgi:uncharacterized protein YwqG